MQTITQRPTQRPKLYLPLFLCDETKRPTHGGGAYPLSREQLRRAVAEMID